MYIIMNIKQKEIKIEPSIKLNCNIYIPSIRVFVPAMEAQI